MIMSDKNMAIEVLNVSEMAFTERLTAISLQGIVNRDGPIVYLDWGIYDDESCRTTNEVFISDDLWRSKYRDILGNQDQKNLDYYRSVYSLEENATDDLQGLLNKYADRFKGIVVWDSDCIDTVNLAAMYCSLDNLLISGSDELDSIIKTTGLEVRVDLRGKWKERVSLYRWAYENLFDRCLEGVIASIEPGWLRPEFLDYVIQNRIFVYNLGALENGAIFSLGQRLLMLLVGGPFGLRNFLFNRRADRLLKKTGLWLMGLGSKEVHLANRIQKAVKPTPYPTIFGWHTKRDDEFSFMLHLSANGLRLIPSHLAANFSFHGRLPANTEFSQPHATRDSVRLEKDKTYLTFTLSDGDQLVLMHTAQLGNWFREERGKVPFNWETQPLLVEIAPALLRRYYDTLTDQDYLVAGPSGAGYMVPPLPPDLKGFLEESVKICRKADIKTFTSYIGDPSDRIIREHGEASEDFLGFMGGYVHFGRTPAVLTGKRAFVANVWPPLDNVGDSAEETLAGVKRLLDQPEPTPRFIGVHLFAYRTTVKDVYQFVQSLDSTRIKVVKADEFLLAAEQYLEENPAGL